MKIITVASYRLPYFVKGQDQENIARQFFTHYINKTALHLINVDLSSSNTTLYSVIKLRQIIATP